MGKGAQGSEVKRASYPTSCDFDEWVNLVLLRGSTFKAFPTSVIYATSSVLLGASKGNATMEMDKNHDLRNSYKKKDFVHSQRSTIILQGKNTGVSAGCKKDMKGSI